MLPIQIILLALLNDVPIITLAFDRVKLAMKPAHIDAKKRAILSTLFGTVGIANSMLMLVIAVPILHLPWAIVQTIFFLKFTVSGHMLLYVAHTSERWYRFLPSKEVIWATTITQLVATTFALFGVFMTAISWQLVVFVWVWAFFWMQIAELTKWLRAVRA